MGDGNADSTACVALSLPMNDVFQEAGADAIELNLSCPHGMGERGMGMACGQVGWWEVAWRMLLPSLDKHCAIKLIANAFKGTNLSTNFT